MLLIDLLSVIDENIKRVDVFDLTGKALTAYDGKDSINERYNNKQVKSITANKSGVLEITLNFIQVY